jgi:anaerobic magnesium-protoporphyrin IX monomethyl ester cyclase
MKRTIQSRGSNESHVRVALVHPPPRSEFDRHWARFPALGIAYVASSLRAAGHDVQLLDGKLDYLTVDEIVDRVRESPPDLVGISCMTVEFPRAVEIARRIKLDRAEIPIVVGGAHVNAVGQQALAEGEAFDFACVGEGEYLTCELAEAIARNRDPAGILGLVSRREGEIVTAPPRPPPEDYDALPFPAWDLFKPVNTLPLLTHRGCPFQCVFCGHNSGFKPRYRTPANVLDEVDEILVRYRPDRIRIEDETFGLHMGRTKAILEGIIERGLHRRVQFSAQTRVDRVDQEFMSLLKTANFEELELGVESGNPEMLLAIRKGITVEQVEHAVALARANDLKIWCKFILGHPNETHETVRDTMSFIVKLNPDQLSVSIMTPFPGTPIHEMALRGEGGYRMLSGGWEDFDKYSSGVLELETISLGQLKRYQIACYLNLYARNWRFRELVRLMISHRAVGWEMLRSTAGRTSRELFAKVSGRKTEARPQTARPAPESPAESADHLPVPVLHPAFGRFRGPPRARAPRAPEIDRSEV